MNVVKRKNSKGDKAYFSIEYGRNAGERMATGIFIYIRPKDQLEKNHNKEELILVETKKSELLLEQQAIGTGFIPSHKFKANFLDYYGEFAKYNACTDPLKGWNKLSNQFSHVNLGYHGKKVQNLFCRTEASDHPGGRSAWGYPDAS
jgi:hypothetical protein